VGVGEVQVFTAAAAAGEGAPFAMAVPWGRGIPQVVGGGTATGLLLLTHQVVLAEGALNPTEAWVAHTAAAVATVLLLLLVVGVGVTGIAASHLQGVTGGQAVVVLGAPRV
jgi:hypothetical protein